jgi:3-phosphoshikimate 1-carboxyvinyltransferase
MHERPIGSLARALTAQGVGFAWEGREGYPPFVLETEGLAGGNMAVDAAESSQYLSGLLLAAPMARSEAVVALAGEQVVSWPYVALTLQAMQDFGINLAAEVLADGKWQSAPWQELAEVTPGRVRFRIAPQSYQARDRRIEGDWSNASYFLAAGAAGPRPVEVRGLRRDSLQGDRAILDILRAMGAEVAWNDAGDKVTVSPRGLCGTRVDMGRCPDLVPTVAVLAAFAHGRTTITGVPHLKIKECDRLACPAAELARAGIRAEVFGDGLVVTPGPLRRERILFQTYKDHRMAMSLSLLGLAGVEVSVDDPDVVGKSFPGFWAEWAKVLRP